MVDNVLINLYKDWDFIKSIPVNVKPCFQDKSLVYVNEWFVTIKRRWKGEKGELGVVYVDNLINLTENIYNKLEKNKNLTELETLRNSLESSLVGLENLVITYKKDGQLSVSENYKDCITKVKNIIKTRKTKFFGSNPKLL